MYVFGDSLSDAGTFVSNSAPTTGLKFTVNPYAVWDQVLGASYGITVSPYLANLFDASTGTLISSKVVGGTNYAQGGSCVSSAYGAHCPINALSTLGVSKQISTYLTSTNGVANPNALYAVYAGGNDTFSQMTFVNKGLISTAAAVTNMATAGAAEAANVAALTTAGAKYIIAPNLVDVGSTPFGASLGSSGAALATALADGYDRALYASLKAQGGTNIIFANVKTLLSEVIAAPTTYGLSNVTSAACTTRTSLICTPATLVSPDAARTHLFADSVHLTPAGQLIAANYIASIIDAPGAVGMIVESPIYAGRAIYHTLDGRIDPTDRQGDGFGLYGNIDIEPLTIDKNRNHKGTKGTATSGYAGLDYQFSNGLTAGILTSFSNGTYDFGSSDGHYGADLFAGTLYASYRLGGGFAQLSGTVGHISYDNVTRRFTLGAGVRKDSGNTDGTYWSARLAAGYDFMAGSRFKFGPIAALTYQYASAGSYSEIQGNSTAMHFGDQSRKLFYGTIGAKAKGTGQVAGLALSPSIAMAYHYDLTDQKRSLLAGLVNAPTNFSMPVYHSGRSWTTVDLGLGVAITPTWTVNLAVGSQFGQSDVTSYYGNVGFAHSF